MIVGRTGKWLFVGGIAILAMAAAERVLVHGHRVAAAAAGESNPSDAGPEPEARAGIRVVGFGHVDIDGGTTMLSVPIAGQVAEVFVKEGDDVRAGQEILRLDDAQARAQLAAATAAVREANVRLGQARRAPADHESRLKQQAQAVAAAKARVEAQRRQVEKLEKLSQSSAFPLENYQSAADRLVEAEAARTVEELKLDQLRLEHPADMLSVAEANLAATEARRAMAADAVAKHILLAPEAGKILRLQVNKGQILGGGVPLPAAWFCAARPRIVRCEIDQEFASRVQLGMSARIYTDAGDTAAWQGTVQRIADWIAPRRSMLDEPFQKNDVRTLECIVALDAGQAPLLIGERVRVELLQGKVTDRPAKIAAASH